MSPPFLKHPTYCNASKELMRSLQINFVTNGFSVCPPLLCLSHSHTHTHAHSHTRTRTHTYTLSLSPSRFFSRKQFFFSFCIEAMGWKEPSGNLIIKTAAPFQKNSNFFFSSSKTFKKWEHVLAAKKILRSNFGQTKLEWPQKGERPTKKSKFILKAPLAIMSTAWTIASWKT